MQEIIIIIFQVCCGYVLMQDQSWNNKTGHAKSQIGFGNLLSLSLLNIQFI